MSVGERILKIGRYLAKL